MPNYFTSGFVPNASFTIPPIPTTFFPGQTPSSALLDLTGPAGSSNTATRAGLLVGSSATPSAIPSSSEPVASSHAQVTSPISSTVPQSSAQITGVSAANLDEPSITSFAASASSSAAPIAGVSSTDVNPAGANSNPGGPCLPEIPAPKISESVTRHAHQQIANHHKGHGSH
ncbi:RGase C [Penicillium malachiteum]|uniref:RGase C n=1 Tax=Penicillium malachiteum TaxID=1324776 RepID=A0AAD6HC38_9EURO|nr:RGase C [Penicillium malachiteum]